MRSFAFVCVAILAGNSIGTFAQSQADSGKIVEAHFEDGARHRFINGPTFDFSLNNFACISLGGQISLVESGSFLSPQTTVGVFLVDNYVLLEVGAQELFVKDPAEGFPLMAGIRTQLYRDDIIALGLGYQYNDISYRYDSHYRIQHNALHWIYGGIALTPGKHTFALNAGLRTLDGEDLYLALSAGAAISVGEHWKLLLDAGHMGTDSVRGLLGTQEIVWIWTGMRYYNDFMTVDLTTFVGLFWALVISVPIS